MKGKKEIIIGITMIIAIAGLLFGIQYLKGINFFNNNRTFFTYYNNVSGLAPGSVIHLKGKKIGVVKDEYLDPVGKKNIIVELNISNNDIQIPVNSKAMFTSSMLGGAEIEIILGEDTIYNEKGIYVGTVPAKGYFLKDGDTITPSYKFGVTEMVTQRIEPIEAQVTASLARVNNVLASVENVLGKDGNELSAVMNSLKGTLNTLNGTVKDVDNLVKENNTYITNTLKNVESITENLKKSNQKVSNLISNFSDLSDSLKNTDIKGTVEEAKLALAGVSKVMDEINNGNGSVHQLIYSDSLINNLNGMIAEAQRLVENIKTHPNRYLQFAVFGSKDKGVKLDATEEKKLKQLLNQ